MENEYETLNHTKWECEYHVVSIPKRRRKTLYGGLRRYLGDLFRTLAQHRESRIVEGHLIADHVHMLLSIPPKYAVAQVVGYMKGKSAINIARTFMGKKRNFVGQHFWTHGYFVSTVGVAREAVGPLLFASCPCAVARSVALPRCSTEVTSARVAPWSRERHSAGFG